MDLPKRVDPSFRRGLNAQLSGDMVVRVLRVSVHFMHGLMQRKKYRYFIYNGLIVPPQLRLSITRRSTVGCGADAATRIADRNT